MGVNTTGRTAVTYEPMRMTSTQDVEQAPPAPPPTPRPKEKPDPAIEQEFVVYDCTFTVFYWIGGLAGFCLAISAIVYYTARNKCEPITPDWRKSNCEVPKPQNVCSECPGELDSARNATLFFFYTVLLVISMLGIGFWCFLRSKGRFDPRAQGCIHDMKHPMVWLMMFAAAIFCYMIYLLA
jgi:hypothetical protein